MAEYIDREALPNCKECIHDGVCGLQERCFDIELQLKEFGCDDFKPAADVVEVRHGEWLPDYEIFVNEPFDTYIDRVQTGWKCSLCGRVECAKEPYCHCGAKMDRKGEGE